MTGLTAKVCAGLPPAFTVPLRHTFRSDTSRPARPGDRVPLAALLQALRVRARASVLAALDHLLDEAGQQLLELSWRLCERG